jgi:hypothetical protein
MAADDALERIILLLGATAAGNETMENQLKDLKDVFLPRRLGAK